MNEPPTHAAPLPAPDAAGPGSRLDITDTTSTGGGGGDGRGAGGAAGQHRPFLQVFFRCSNQYLRVNRNADGSGYKATCPTCGKRLNFVVGPGGTSERFFEVSC